MNTALNKKVEDKFLLVNQVFDFISKLFGASNTLK